MNNKDLIEKLSEFIRIKDELVETGEIAIDASMLKIRDTLLKIGTLLRENLEEEYYIGTLAAGIGNKNTAYIIIKKNKNKNSLDVCCYAREGLIKQHTARKAINKFERELLR